MQNLTAEQIKEFLDPIVGGIETACRQKGFPLWTEDSDTVYFSIEDAIKRSRNWVK